MNGTMKEALMYAIGDLRVVESPIPTYNQNEVLMRVKVCSVCPTDIRKYRTGNHGVLKLPMNLGHEFSGDIVEVGSLVPYLKPGMRVLGDGFVGYAQYATVPEEYMSLCLELPPAVTYEEATFAEPLADCVYCIERQANVKINDKIAIIGAGPMGLMKMMVAKRAGIKVMHVDVLEHRLGWARKFGADLAVKADEMEKVAKEWTDGKGLDAVILSAGVPDAVNKALIMVKNRGHVVLFGGFKHGSMSTIDPNLIHYKEAVLTGSYWVGVKPYQDQTYYLKSLELIAEKTVPVAQLITHRFPLDQIEEAFKVMESLEGLKVMVEIP